jgi:hypothetical protein
MLPITSQGINTIKPRSKALGLSIAGLAQKPILATIDLDVQR